MYEESLMQALEATKKVRRYSNVNEANMVDLMLQSDLAVVPASGVLYEALATGCRVVTGKYIEHQSTFLEEFSKLPQVVSAHDFSENELTRALKEAGEIDSECETIIDGKSKERFVSLFEKLI